MSEDDRKRNVLNDALRRVVSGIGERDGRKNAERKIVEWLRSLPTIEMNPGDQVPDIVVDAILVKVADMIERGEHRR